MLRSGSFFPVRLLACSFLSALVSLVAAHAPAEAATGPAPTALYWVDDYAGEIYLTQLPEGPGSTTWVMDVGYYRDTYALAVDEAAGRFFWANLGASSGMIKTSDLQGQGEYAINGFRDGIVIDVAIDPIAEHVYYLIHDRQGEQHIIDRTSYAPPHNTWGLHSFSNAPKALALDHSVGRLCWIESGTIPDILCEHPAGPVDYPIPQAQNIVGLTDITFDTDTHVLYYQTLSGIFRFDSNGDGSDLEQIYAGSSLEGRMEIDPNGSGIYWSEGGQIKRMDLDGSNVEVVVASAASRVRGIGFSFAAQTPVVPLLSIATQAGVGALMACLGAWRLNHRRG